MAHNLRAPDSYIDWDTVAHDAVGVLRAEAGRDPYDRRLSDLVGELSTRSEEFRVGWAAHDVKIHRTGAKRFHHPLVGDLTSPTTPSRCRPTPGSPSSRAVVGLGSGLGHERAAGTTMAVTG